MNKETKANSSYVSADLFCRCFQSDSVVTSSDCTSPFTIRARDIVSSSCFYKSSSDQHKIAELKRLFFDRRSGSEAINSGIDSRFALLLKRDNMEGDTFVLYSSNELIYNEKYLYNYNFDIMDSVRRILGYSQIDCELP